MKQKRFGSKPMNLESNWQSAVGRRYCRRPIPTTRAMLSDPHPSAFQKTRTQKNINIRGSYTKPPLAHGQTLKLLPTQSEICW